MILRIVYKLVAVFLLSIINGQAYNNVRAKQDGLSINISYDMEGKLYRGDKVAIVYSVDDG